MATLVNNTQYLPDVLSEVPTCPNIIALEKIRDTIIEVCQESSIWREELATISVVASTALYPLVFTTGSQLAQVNYAYLVDANSDEKWLDGSSEDAIASASGKSWRTQEGEPKVYYMDDPKTIRFALTPSKAYTAYIGVILKPTPDSTQAPDYIYDQYHETIAKGAIAKLLDMNGRPWYSPDKAALDKRKYNNMKAEIRVAATRSHTRTAKSVTMRPIA